MSISAVQIRDLIGLNRMYTVLNRAMYGFKTRTVLEKMVVFVGENAILYYCTIIY